MAFALAGCASLPPPTAVLNIGGVANLTTISGEGEVAACDTGPGNGLIDLWAERHGRGRFDADGALARAGRVDERRLAAMMRHPYFAQPAFAEQPPDGEEIPIPAPIVEDAQHAALLARQNDERRAVVEIGDERLVDHDMLARRQCRARKRGVRLVGRGDDDQVDRRVGDQRLGVPIYSRFGKAGAHRLALRTGDCGERQARLRRDQRYH